MQFRERSKVIQVIRTVYDPAIKRGRAEVVVRLDREDPVLSDDVRAACSPAELDEIEAFLAERQALLSREATREAAEGLARQIRLAEAFFRDAGPSTQNPGMPGEGGTAAVEILAAWDDLKKTLHKAGFRKQKSRL